MIVAAFLWAIYSIYSRKFLQEKSTMMVTTIIFGLGSLYLLPFAILEAPWIVIREITWMGWTSILYLALLCSVFAYFAWNRAISQIETVKVGMFLYLIPIITSILSYFVLGETLTIATLVGGALVLIGVFITETA